MEIKNTKNLPVEVIDTVSFCQQDILVCLENDEEIGHYTIKMFYDDRNGENWLRHFKIGDNDGTMRKEDVAEEFFNYVKSDIALGLGDMRTSFEPTQKHYDYIDNVIDKVISEFEIYED